MPTCAGCGDTIKIRGDDPRASVIVGELLECLWPGGAWLAHFFCRRADWWYATPTDFWAVRTIGDRTYNLLTSRPRWAEQDPQVRYLRKVS